MLTSPVIACSVPTEWFSDFFSKELPQCPVLRVHSTEQLIGQRAEGEGMVTMGVSVWGPQWLSGRHQFPGPGDVL